jgi:hypothetical protein
MSVARTDCLTKAKYMKEILLKEKKVMGIIFGILSRLPFHDCLMKHMKEVSLDTNKITLVVLSGTLRIENNAITFRTLDFLSTTA